MLLIKNLTKRFSFADQDFYALKNIDLEVKEGQIFGVIGKSGAGKSTLLRSINGLETPTEGEIWIDQQNILNLTASKQRQIKAKIGTIFQHFNLLRSRTVWGNIALPLELQNWPKEKINARVEELLTLTNLSQFANQTPNRLSGGQKQRVAIARALANHPKILLCDEATSALDPSATKAILELLKSINEKLKITIFLITHELDVIKSICHRVAVIDHGVLIEENNTIDIFSQPKNTLTKEFVTHAFAIEIPENIKQKLHDLPGPNMGTLIQIAYHGSVADQPIMSQLQQAYQIQVNIIQGKIETVQNQTLGHLLVEILGQPANQIASIDYLKKNGLTVKTLGYVHRNP